MSEQPLPIRIAQVVGITTASATAGASLSLSFLLVPRLLESPVPLLLRQWKGAFEAGKKSIPGLSGLAATSYFYLAYASRQQQSSFAKWKIYLLAGLLSVGIVPYTVGFMFETNKKLLKKAEETRELRVTDEVQEKGGETAQTAHRLVDRWGLLNLGRGALLSASGVLGLWTALL